MPLRAVAHHPTGINMSITEGLGKREWKGLVRYGEGCSRTVYADPAVGQPAGHVGHHLPIPPHITETGTHRAKPIYFCLITKGARPAHKHGPTRHVDGADVCESREIIRQCCVISFKGTLKVGFKPADPNRRELPV